MNKVIPLNLYYFKPNMIHLINSHLIDYQIRNAITTITSKLVNNNQKTKKYFSKYINISSYISYSLINNVFLQYYSSSLTDCLFNLINISSYNNNLPISSIDKFSISKTLFLFTKFIEPICLEKIRKNNFGIVIIKGIKVSNIVLKLLYLIKDNFMYTDFINYCFGIITINKGKNDDNINLYLSFIYFFIISAYKCYKKIQKEEIKKEKKRKTIIKIINENRKNEVIPPPNNDYYLLRNKNFLNIIKNKKGLCLICNKKFCSPTAIRCCGGVFCFECIYNYLLLNQKCYLCFQYFTLNEKDIKSLLIKIYS